MEIIDIFYLFVFESPRFYTAAGICWLIADFLMESSVQNLAVASRPALSQGLIQEEKVLEHSLELPTVT